MTWSEEGTCPSMKQLGCFVLFQSFYGGHEQNTVSGYLCQDVYAHNLLPCSKGRYMYVGAYPPCTDVCFLGKCVETRRVPPMLLQDT